MFDFFAFSSLATSIASIAFGFFVYLKNKRSPLNVLWWAVSMAVAVWSFGLFGEVLAKNEWEAFLWNRLLYFGAIFVPIFYFHFVLIVLGLAEKYKKILNTGYWLSIFYLFVNYAPQFISNFPSLFAKGVPPAFGFSYWLEPGPLYYVYFLTFVFYILFSVFLLSYWLPKTSGIKKQQIRYVLFTGIVGFGGGLTDFFPQLIKIYPFGNFFVVFYIVFMAYAITRYRLMEIKTIIRRSTVFGLLVLIMATAYAALTFFITKLFDNFFVSSSTIATNLISSALIVLGFTPLKNLLQKLTDKFLFTGEYNSAKLLARINEICSSILNLDQLLTSLSDEITKAFRTGAISVILLDEKTKKLDILKQDGWSGDFNAFVKGNAQKLPLYFRQSNEIYVIPELKVQYENGEYKPYDAKFLQQLDEIDINLIVPLFAHESLIGVIVLGPKKSGDPYSQEDLNILNIISGQAAIAITNTRLYEEQKNYAINLQKEVEKATAELRQANAELKKLDEAKSDFISIASHQLRTPLTVIKGYGSMIKEGSFGKVPKKIMEVIDKVYISNERLIDLVENLLNISRIESGRLEFKMQKMNLVDLAQDVFDELKQKADAKKLKYSLKVEKNVPLIFGDVNRLHDVISNLIDNSIKYTPAGKVEVAVRSEDGLVLFEVKDTGSGIDPKDLPHLFQKFTRAQGAFQIHTEGVGLGLYVARMMMDKMSGKIWAESEGLNKGSRFAFTIPPAK